jgi:amino acid transporter
MRGTDSVGATLLFWAAGALYGITGAYVYIELALTLPRHKVNGLDTGIPRSGGTLNYIQYAFNWPAYRPGTVRLVTCLFAITYVVIGNMAGNCLIFGIRVLMAANVPVTNGTVRGIAICVATAACFIHSFSRRGGIWLGNVFALLKILILVLIIITSICALAGAFHGTSSAEQNLSIHNSFANASQDSYGYTQAFLSVLFASAGFEQPNYVSYQVDM